MPTSAYNTFQDFTEQLIRGQQDFDTNTFKVALTNTLPVNTNTVFSNITEITAGNGYTAGGEPTTISIVEASGTTTVSGTQVQWTGSGAGMATFRYAVLYNSSTTYLIAWFDYGAGGVTLAASETFTLKFNNANPGTIFTLGP